MKLRGNIPLWSGAYGLVARLVCICALVLLASGTLRDPVWHGDFSSHIWVSISVVIAQKANSIFRQESSFSTSSPPASRSSHAAPPSFFIHFRPYHTWHCWTNRGSYIGLLASVDGQHAVDVKLSFSTIAGRSSVDICLRPFSAATW